MIASEQFLKTERKANMRKIIAAACLMAAMTLCVGCSSAKDGSKDTTKATTETKMKVQSKYKVPKITAAKKTDQLADAQKGETIVTMKVKGYGEMQFKFFMKKAPLAVKNFVTLASNGYFDGQIFHRVINDFMIQSGDPTGTGTGGESIWGETLIMKYVRNFCLFAVLYVWQIPEQIRMEVSFLSCRRKQIQRRKVWKKEM